MISGQLALDLGHRAAFGREDFLVAACNHASIDWLDRWPAWPTPALVVHGPPASGKTHLVHVWRAQVVAAGEEAVPVEPADLALRPPAELLQGARAAAVEDVDRRVCGDPGRETGLFHLYNHLAVAGGHLLLSGRAAPSAWPAALADLASRVKAAAAVAIAPPDDALIAAVLVKLFADRQLRVGEDVVAYLLTRMERSFAAARGVVDALDGAALAARRNITVPLAREVLGGLDHDSEGGD